jgi:flavin reductase (DIM6/NTAB) family NADH-FMN oxidoreductase RutF
MLGLECNSKTYQNLMEQKECVINFPSALLFDRVEKIEILQVPIQFLIIR